MATSMPLTLIIAWVIFSGSVNTHLRHSMRFHGTSQVYLSALQFSVYLGCLVGVGLLGYYFTQVEWYYPIVLFLVGWLLVAPLLFSLLDATIGILGTSTIAFISWPLSAIWFFLTIQGLHP